MGCSSIRFDSTIIRVDSPSHWKSRGYPEGSADPALGAARPGRYHECPREAVFLLRPIRRRAGDGTLCGVGFPKSFRPAS